VRSSDAAKQGEREREREETRDERGERRHKTLLTKSRAFCLARAARVDGRCAAVVVCGVTRGTSPEAPISCLLSKYLALCFHMERGVRVLNAVLCGSTSVSLLLLFPASAAFFSALSAPPVFLSGLSGEAVRLYSQLFAALLSFFFFSNTLHALGFRPVFYVAAGFSCLLVSRALLALASTAPLLVPPELFQTFLAIFGFFAAANFATQPRPVNALLFFLFAAVCLTVPVGGEGTLVNVRAFELVQLQISYSAIVSLSTAFEFAIQSPFFSEAVLFFLSAAHAARVWICVHSCTTYAACFVSVFSLLVAAVANSHLAWKHLTKEEEEKKKKVE
jgi:hypothetical protein